MSARLAGYTTTTAVLGGNKVMKVRQWQAYSEPSDTYFEVRARQQTTQGQVQTIADGFSATIEALLAAPDYTAVSWAQDVNAAGQLISVFTVYWYIPEKDESGFVEIPAGLFDVDHVAQQVLIDSGPGTFALAP
jgi:hypothetical protein